ncbi:MAG: hypothetical protein ACTSVY_04650 [Candidatus Helarchaeota archaeon]
MSKVVLTVGVFNLFHQGHPNLFKYLPPSGNILKKLKKSLREIC